MFFSKPLTVIAGIIFSGLCWYFSAGLNGDYWWLLWIAPLPVLLISLHVSQGKAFLYVYTPNRDIDYTTYELNPLPYVAAAQELFIGITPQGPLFPPFPGPTVLYPFQGLIGDVSIFDKVLDEDALRNHVMNAFYNI